MFKPAMQRSERMKFGSCTFVMGILNITPDSFSGDGLISAETTQAAVQQAKQFVEDGADILDVGGESTRPNSTAIDSAYEQARVLPAIKAIRAELPEVLISIDSYRAATAHAALEAGANWINDVWGLKKDPAMAQVAAEADCPIVLMHNGRDRERQARDEWEGGYYGYYHYDDLLGEVKAELQDSVNIALAAGVSAENIILDPGIGFGKNGRQNLELINRLDELKTLNFPILLGTSRKGFIGHYLGGLPANERLEGTAATIAIGIDRGADIVRVHDVKEMARVAKLTDAITRVTKNED